MIWVGALIVAAVLFGAALWRAVGDPRRAPEPGPPSTGPGPAPIDQVTIPASESKQCPRCGRHQVQEAPPEFACEWCGNRWQVGAGELWPDVTLCLWIPAVGGSAKEEK